MGSLEDALRRREDVEDAEIGAIIELASRLQEEAQAEARRLSPAEVVAIAGELDIAGEYVEAAIARRREEAQKEAEAAAARAIEGRARRRRVGGVVAAITGVSLVISTIAAASSARAIERARIDVDATRARLDQVIDRTFAAAPAQLALVGGDPADLAEASAALDAARDVDDRIAATRRLGDALASALAALPRTDDPAQSQLRLNLHYERQGADNRLATELQRHEAARRGEAAARAGFGARLALGLGLVE